MRPKIYHISFLILSLGLSSLWAQTPASSPPPKIISKGVVNGSAVSLPKPVYPAAAKTVRASGTVSVQVTIDETGNVISAQAVGGHPLLQSAAVEAARQAKFKPTLLQGQPVKVSGIITYNFVMAMSLMQIGYELSFAEKSMLLKNLTITSLYNGFPGEWTEEKADLKQLDTYLAGKKSEEIKAQSQQQALSSSASADNTSDNKSADKKVVVAIVSNGAGVDNYSQMLDDESVKMLAELQSKIENRLSSDLKTLWAYRLGRVLGKISAEIDDSELARANLDELNSLGKEAPSGTSEAALSKIREIVDSFRQPASDEQRKETVTSLVDSLRNLKIY